VQKEQEGQKGAYKGLLLAAVARETTKGLFFTTTCTFSVASVRKMIFVF
jgi:hypothetical protein